MRAIPLACLPYKSQLTHADDLRSLGQLPFVADRERIQRMSCIPHARGGEPDAKPKAKRKGAVRFPIEMMQLDT
jgi:hypothetical protein